MTETFNIKKVAGNDDAALDLVFIHGLTGDATGTWTNSEGEYWPNWIFEQYPNVAIHTVGYPASLYEHWAKKEMDIVERAQSALEYMVSIGIGERPLALICHSLGGILAKQIIRSANDSKNSDWKNFANNVNLICFLATPHTGASLGNVVNFIFPKLSSTHITNLVSGNQYLTDLNQFYRDYVPDTKIKTLVYYEKYKTKNVALVVDDQSADPGVLKVRPIAVDADHLDICKPVDRNGFIHLTICRHIKNLLKEIEAVNQNSPPPAKTFQEEGYEEKFSHDRRDLLEKLIAANKEDDYPLANDLQNQFAQRYMRLGLFSDEKNKQDLLLAEIEQRFNLHVYKPKICKYATEEDIANALQMHVIDAVRSHFHEWNLSARTILKGLYFLTEQCHICWDAR